MSCNNCNDFDNNSCTDIVSSNCIRWQGDVYNTEDNKFEICLGDTLTDIGNTILSYLEQILRGRDIIVEDLDLEDCSYLDDILDGEDKTLVNLFNTFKQGICSLNSQITETESLIAEFITLSTYTLGCLDPLTDPCDETPTFHTLIQALIDNVCNLLSQMDTINNNITDIVLETIGDNLEDFISSPGGNGISYHGSGASATVSIEALVPPSCPIIYIGSLGNFDGDGIGLDGTAYEGWYLCNGDNGTPDSANLPQGSVPPTYYIMRLT